jgi:threonine aldolase
MIPQHASDNRRAKDLAAALSRTLGAGYSLHPVETNIVFLTTRAPAPPARDLQASLKEHGVLVWLASEDTLRLVTHRHIGDGEVAAAADAFGKLAAR